MHEVSRHLICSLESIYSICSLDWVPADRGMQGRMQSYPNLQVDECAMARREPCRVTENILVVVQHRVERLNPLWINIAITHNPRALLQRLLCYQPRRSSQDSIRPFSSVRVRMPCMSQLAACLLG